MFSLPGLGMIFERWFIMSETDIILIRQAIIQLIDYKKQEIEFYNSHDLSLSIHEDEIKKASDINKHMIVIYKDLLERLG